MGVDARYLGTQKLLPRIWATQLLWYWLDLDDIHMVMPLLTLLKTLDSP